MGKNYTFPAIANAGHCMGRQLKKIAEELAEVNSAYDDALISFIKDDGTEISALERSMRIEHVVMELWDVCHATETALRMIEFDGIDVDSLHDQVVMKNDKRGYYGSPDEHPVDD